MNKKKLEIKTERDPIIDLITDKNNTSPLISRKNNTLPNKNNLNPKKRNMLSLQEDSSLFNNLKTSYPLKSPLASDISKLNLPVSNINLRNNTFFQNNFYKGNVINKSQNLNKIILNTNSNFNASNKYNNSDLDKLENLNKFNFSPEYINKNFKMKDIMMGSNYQNSNQNFFSPQNQQLKKPQNFSPMNYNTQSDREPENSNKTQMQKILSKIDSIKLQNNTTDAFKFSQINQKQKAENSEKTKFTTFSNEAIMNLTNKNLNLNFEVNPKVIKKENLLNVSGIEKDVNYYDFPSNNDIPINFEILFSNFPGYEAAKSSKKQISELIRSYAANTYQGIIR